MLNVCDCADVRLRYQLSVPVSAHVMRSCEQLESRGHPPATWQTPASFMREMLGERAASQWFFSWLRVLHHLYHLFKIVFNRIAVSAFWNSVSDTQDFSSALIISRVGSESSFHLPGLYSLMDVVSADTHVVWVTKLDNLTTKFYV